MKNPTHDQRKLQIFLNDDVRMIHQRVGNHLAEQFLCKEIQNMKLGWYCKISHLSLEFNTHVCMYVCVNYKIWCSLAKVVDLSYTATPCSLIASQNSAILVYTTSISTTTSSSTQLLFSLFFCNKKSVQKEVWKTLNVVRLKPLGRQIYSQLFAILVEFHLSSTM